MRPAHAAAGLLLLLGGCVQGDLDTQDQVVAVTGVVAADLRVALADADVHADRAASQCYRALLERVEALPDRTAGPVVGAISAFQKVRNARRAIDAGVPDDVHIACAALVADSRVTTLRLLSLFRIAF
jgi:hypothetical protein